MIKIQKARPLTDEQCAQAKTLLNSGVALKQIARDLGTTRHYIDRALFPERYKRKLERERYYFAGWKTQTIIGPQSMRVVPEAVLAERERVRAIEPTPNMLILGDPPPIRSALYKARERA